VGGVVGDAADFGVEGIAVQAAAGGGGGFGMAFAENAITAVGTAGLGCRRNESQT
jgi:hypothetical protein